MANTAFVHVKAGGQDIPVLMDYDNTMANMGSGNNVENCLQVLRFEAGVTVGVAGGSNIGSQAQSGRRHAPWNLRVLVGKGFPLLFKAIRRNEEIELELKIFVEHPTTGATELLHTAKITRGRLVGLTLVAPDVLDPQMANHPIYADMLVVGHTYEHSNGPGNTTDTDNSAERDA